jgi:cystathionine gamma-synthase
VADLDAVAEVTQRYGIPLIVDATFASPWNLRPLVRKYPADIVVHSLTKFINGHNNASGGSVSGRRDLIEAVEIDKGQCGGGLSPQSAFEILRGLQTFHLRMPEHNRNALHIAQLLERHRLVERVWYPFLESHPDFLHAKKHLKGGGGVLSFKLIGDGVSTAFFLDQLKRFGISASFGGINPMIQPTQLISYSNMPEAERAKIGITPTLVRLSAGINKSAEDQSRDLLNALERLAVFLERRPNQQLEMEF